MKNFTLIRKIISFSLLSLLVFTAGAQTYVMGNLGNISTCSGTFYDSGNQGANYSNSESFVFTFCSSTAQDLYLQFTQFKLETNFDSLYIYDGSTTSAPLIGGFTGSTLPGNMGTIVSTNASHCLTLYFKSDGSVTYLGWVATVGCGVPPPPPPPPPPATNTSCALSAPFCSGTNYNFPAATNTTAEVGPAYGCVLTQPNPVWYYLQIDTGGNLNITLSNTASADVDFVCWGPFATSSACGSLTAANIVDCSYSTSAIENINIAGATTGQYYTLMITNFSNMATNFTITTDNTSTATTNCLILCNITSMTAVPGPCDTATNQYNVTGSIALQYPPVGTDTLTITSSAGDSVVLYSPFTNPINYALGAHISNGSTVTVNAQFARDSSCHFTTTYAAPASCICSVNATNSSPVCTGDSVNLTIVTTGTITNYQWTGPGGYTSAQPNPVIYNNTIADTGVYTITITAGICTASDTTHVTLFPSPVLGVPTITNSTCTTGGSVSVTATGGVGTISYIWSTGGNTNTISNLAAGPYDLTATDQNGCSTSATYTVGAAPNAITFSVPSITDVTCNGNADGSITANATGGTGVISYVWSNTLTTATISGLIGNTYSVIASDVNGCSASVAYVVNEPTAIVFAAPVITNYTCTAGGTITVSASGGTGAISFSWSNAQTGSSISNLNPGNYIVTATDQNLCMVTASYTINSAANVVLLNAPTITNVSCFGGNDASITANPSGGNGVYTYSWSNTLTTATISSLTVGQYMVSVSDGTGCSASASYTVTEPVQLVIDSADVQNIGCSGTTGSITVYVSGGTVNYSYNWVQQSNSQAYSGQSINNLSADNYNLTVTDSKSCSVTGTYTITQATPLTFSQSQTDVSCFGGSNGTATVSINTGTAPYTYNWNGTGPSPNSTLNGVSAGIVNVTINDANCNATATFTILEPTQIQISQVSQTDVSCSTGSDGTITVSATGGSGAGYTYSWNSTLVQTGATATGLPAGTITVVATDGALCTASQTYTIAEPTPLTAAPVPTDARCYQAADGTIDANAAGGTPPYTYLWTDSQTTKVAFALVSGTYSCTVTDNKGCTAIGTSVINEPSDMLIDTSTTAVKCVGDKNGTITVTASGGTSPYNFYATQDGANFIYATNGVIIGLAAGVYTVGVADDHGCTKTIEVTVPNATLDNFTTSVDSTTCYGPDYNDGSAHITSISIQNGPYQYSVDGGVAQFSGDFFNLSAGAHTITAVNVNGCVNDVPVLILEPLPIVVDVVPDSLLLPLGESGAVQVNYLNATNVTYSWTPVLGLSCIDCPAPVVSAYYRQDYLVTVSMVNRSSTCYGSATLHVDVLPHQPVFIPNSFSPNGDGNNDVLLIFGEDIKTVDLKIFNRWGELVFTSNNQYAGWDGTYKGELQQPAVFTYAASVIFLDDKKTEKKGTITLVR